MKIINKLTYKNIFIWSEKTLLRGYKDKQQTQRKYLQTIQRMNDLSLEYVKNSQNSPLKKQPKQKMSKKYRHAFHRNGYTVGR